MGDEYAIECNIRLVRASIYQWSKTKEVQEVWNDIEGRVAHGNRKVEKARH